MVQVSHLTQGARMTRTDLAIDAAGITLIAALLFLAMSL